MRGAEAFTADMEIDATVARLAEARRAVTGKVLGQERTVDLVLVAMLARGHVLLEGAPGVGKTLLVRTLAQACGLRSSRIQFTPDLMPADVTGTTVLVYGEDGRPSTTFAEGPVFAELVLADEINRATPKTQSALLEAMQERTVTVAGAEHELPDPFLVLATQNPVEMEGTYVLPEAQIDRFLFRVVVPFPREQDLSMILGTTTSREELPVEARLSPDDLRAMQRWVREVPVPEALLQDVARFARSTQPQLPGNAATVRRSLRLGVSPRGAQALILGAKAFALMEGRYAVAPEDVLDVAAPVLGHRVSPTYEADADGVDSQALVLDLLRRALA